MSAAVILVLDDILERLADPRAWVQGHWRAHRDRNGTVRGIQAGAAPNCWCVGGAISAAVGNVALAEAMGAGTWTELRSEVEMEILLTLMSRDIHVNAAYLWNDDRSTSHADVIDVVTETRARLVEAA